MSRPLKLDFAMARYLMMQKARGRKRFPFVTMLEPLEACNLKCIGCGRVIEYDDILDKKLSVNESLDAIHASGAPIVSIAGGEPLLHPQITEIVNKTIAEKRFVYLCTNGVLLNEKMHLFTPSPYFSFVVHLDGTAKIHDYVTQQDGVYEKAITGIKQAIGRGFRVNTNSTVFHGTDVDDLHALFEQLTKLGVEGLMISPGYAYEDVSKGELFLAKQESIKVFRQVLDPSNGFPFYNNPLYLGFLRGDRNYSCAAWATPTYTPLGWRVPCYTIADRHTDSIGELFEPDLWERFGPENEKRCINCMIHSGFEAASIISAFSKPRDLVTLVRGNSKG